MKTLHLKNIFKAKIKDNALHDESTIYGEQVGEKRCVWVCVCGTFGRQIRGVLVACFTHWLKCAHKRPEAMQRHTCTPVQHQVSKSNVKEQR